MLGRCAGSLQGGGRQGGRGSGLSLMRLAAANAANAITLQDVVCPSPQHDTSNLPLHYNQLCDDFISYSICLAVPQYCHILPCNIISGDLH